MANAPCRGHRAARCAALLVSACLWLLNGCATDGPNPATTPTDAALQLVQGSPYGIAADEDVLALNDEMRAFVVRKIKVLPQEERATALGKAFMRGGALALRYDQQRTRSAVGTFADRAGNCLSFSQLFVSLARAGGLHVRFREYRNVESWSRLGDVLLLNRHVTVWGVQGGVEYDVDFGRLSNNALWLRQLITDQRARAEYFNNLGAEEFAKGAPARAIPYFNRALLIQPDLDFAWTNLAAALRVLGRLGDAEAALQTALRMDPRSESALNGLERLYVAQGHVAAAEKVARTLASYRDRNPYHHFEVAQEALRGSDYETAIHHLLSALRVNPNDPEFNFELGRAYLEQGNFRQAAKRFKRVESLAQDLDQSRIYAARLAALIRAVAPPTAAPST